MDLEDKINNIYVFLIILTVWLFFVTAGLNITMNNLHNEQMRKVNIMKCL